MKNIAVLVSGGGTNIQALIDAQNNGEIKNGKITLVVASKGGVYALERAKQNNINSCVIPRKEYDDVKSYTKAIVDGLIKNNIDIVVYAGFMIILDEQMEEYFFGKMVNVHPALIPSFCGKGYYGLNVHKAVLESGVKVTGATVHIVTKDCDAGPIIIQKAVDVLDDDTPETLQFRVMEQCEWIILPKAVSLLCEEKIEIFNNKTRIIGE